MISCQDTVTAGAEIILDASGSAVKGYSLTGYYWTFGDGKYNSGSFVKHIYRKSGTYKIELGVLARNDQTKKIEKFKLEKNIVIKDPI